MLNQLFNSIYSSTEVKINPLALIFATITSLVLGIVLVKVYKRQTIYTKEFVITLSLLPAIISIIIFLVNGNLGTSVAVAGTFSLIRFRSAAREAKELLAVFMATAIGITTGMGFVALAIVFTLLISFVWLIFEKMDFTSVSQTRRYVIIKIPANFEYELLFEAIFLANCKSIEMTAIESAEKQTIKLEYIIDLLPDIIDSKLMQQFLVYDKILSMSISKAAKKKKTL